MMKKKVFLVHFKYFNGKKTDFVKIYLKDKLLKCRQVRFIDFKDKICYSKIVFQLFRVQETSRKFTTRKFVYFL